MIDALKIVSESAGAEWIYVNNVNPPVAMEGWLTPDDMRAHFRARANEE